MRAIAVPQTHYKLSSTRAFLRLHTIAKKSNVIKAKMRILAAFITELQ
jgi:hypothetical protein